MMPLNLPQDVIDGYLDELKCEFEKGRIDKLFSAIRFCGSEGIPQPEWVVAAFFKATNAWYSLRARTLDEAFGMQSPTDKRFRAAQRRRKLRPAIYKSVERRHSCGENISTELFASVAKEFGVGSTAAKECYYEMREHLTVAPLPSIDKLLQPFIVSPPNSGVTIHRINPSRKLSRKVK